MVVHAVKTEIVGMLGRFDVEIRVIWLSTAVGPSALVETEFDPTTVRRPSWPENGAHHGAEDRAGVRLRSLDVSAQRWIYQVPLVREVLELPVIASTGSLRAVTHACPGTSGAPQVVPRGAVVLVDGAGCSVFDACLPCVRASTRELYVR